VDAAVATQSIRSLLLKDRAIHDKAQKAFVSWLRSYSKHQASSIFRVPDLDWEALGKAWGLLRLPTMPELRKFEGDRTLGVSNDWDNYAYKDKQQEKRRKEKALEAEEEKKNGQQESRKRTATESAAWSQNQENREKRLKRKEIKQTRKENEKWEQLPEEEKQKALETKQMIESLREKNEERRREERALQLSGKPASKKGDDDDDFEGFD
jgi:ATP-dependent RNA helicase DDX55/SPB4